MPNKRNVVIFNNGGAKATKIFEKLVKARFKTPIDCAVRRGDFIAKTTLAATTVANQFPDWNIKHQTPKRIVLEKE